MTIEKKIRTRIEEKFDPVSYELVNESHKHGGHAGDDGSGQTHFKLMVVSDLFEGKSRLERQRLVNSALEDVFSLGLHALSLILKAPSEI
jgi:BolA protein